MTQALAGGTAGARTCGIGGAWVVHYTCKGQFAAGEGAMAEGRRCTTWGEAQQIATGSCARRPAAFSKSPWATQRGGYTCARRGEHGHGIGVLRWGEQDRRNKPALARGTWCVRERENKAAQSLPQCYGTCKEQAVRASPLTQGSTELCERPGRVLAAGFLLQGFGCRFEAAT